MSVWLSPRTSHFVSRHSLNSDSASEYFPVVSYSIVRVRIMFRGSGCLSPSTSLLLPIQSANSGPASAYLFIPSYCEARLLILFKVVGALFPRAARLLQGLGLGVPPHILIQCSEIIHRCKGVSVTVPEHFSPHLGAFHIQLLGVGIFPQTKMKRLYWLMDQDEDPRAWLSSIQDNPPTAVRPQYKYPDFVEGCQYCACFSMYRNGCVREFLAGDRIPSS